MGCGSCNFESRESSRACGEGIALKSHVLEHGEKRLQSGVLFFKSNCKCWPCLNRPTERWIARFMFECLLPFDMFEPKSTAVSFRPRRRRPHKSNTESLPSRAERLPVGYLSEGKHLAIT